MAKNEFYRNFSNRRPFNNIPIGTDEELVPAVLTEDLKDTLKPMGLDYRNVETWTVQHGKKIPVVFIPNKKGFLEVYMKIFNGEIERFLKHKGDETSRDLSLDKFLEDIDDENGTGFDPTGTTENEDTAFTILVIGHLIEELGAHDKNAGNVLQLLAEGLHKKEILNQLNLGKGKTQGYAFIEKAQKAALKLYNEKYR